MSVSHLNYNWSNKTRKEKRDTFEAYINEDKAVNPERALPKPVFPKPT